jgi:hypothetical protein
VGVGISNLFSTDFGIQFFFDLLFFGCFSFCESAIESIESD